MEYRTEADNMASLKRRYGPGLIEKALDFRDPRTPAVLVEIQVKPDSQSIAIRAGGQATELEPGSTTRFILDEGQRFYLHRAGWKEWPYVAAAHWTVAGPFSDVRIDGAANPEAIRRSQL